MSGYVEHAAEGLAILLWSCDPEAPQRLATPFLHAAAAAAMEVPVELYFVARSVHLLVPGVAAALRASDLAGHSVLDHMREAASHGVRFLACSEALRAQGLEGRALIPECQGHGGAVQFMARAIDLRWRTLVY
ncbi:MAG: DsrE family protein [Rubrivivax sp.]